MDSTMKTILAGALQHKPGEPFDASEHPVAAGELMMEGFLSPLLGREEDDADDADVVVRGFINLSFRLTAKAKAAERGR